MKLFLRILNGAIGAVLVLLIFGGVALAVAARRSPDSIPTVLGHKVLSVVSGSMEPAIHTGDVIIVRPLKAGEPISEGDVITYRNQDKADMLITHRVAGTILVNGKATAYVTKGDANPSPDQNPILPEQIVGKYQWRVIYFGYVASFVRKPVGIILFVILPGLVLIGLEFRKIWQALSEAETEGAKAGVPHPDTDTPVRTANEKSDTDP